jgi:hypothetical protein
LTRNWFSAIVIYWRKKWQHNETVRQLFIQFKKAYDSVRREASYSILVGFGVTMKLVRLIIMCLNETYIKIRNGLKQGHALSPFNVALEYSIKVQENQVGLKLIGTHQLLAYSDDLNLLGDNTDAIKKNTETSIDGSKEVGLGINVQKTKYMLLSRHQNVGQNWDIKTANRSFENVSQFKYLGATVTNQI